MLHYTLSLLAPHTHRYTVVLEVPTWADDSATLRLPVWTPGSYLIREFARHVEAFAATTPEGDPLPWQRVDKATWRVEGIKGAFRVRYEVYANELTVRTSHLDSSHGYFNGSNLFVYLDGATHEPLALTIEAPRGWHSSIALPQDEQGRYLALDYDTLADSPGEIGTHRRLSFDALGVPHEIALWGHGNEDEERIVTDLRRIVEGTAAFFGGALPYERYLFIIHLGDRLGGGLEHKDSTTLAVDRWGFQPASDYEGFLRLAVHEFFHVWHVKRIRPQHFGPFDYTKETYTPLLWVMEGFTTYYDLLLMPRLGLISPDRALTLLGERITRYRQQPGRLVQSLAESSHLAWIKLYRPDENSPNSSISYYLKGSLVALLLDIALRHRSDGQRSLDDVMRLLWERFGERDVAFSPDDFARLLDEVAGEPMQPFLDRYVYGTEELPFEEALAPMGLTLRSSTAALPYLGIQTTSEGGALSIRTVLRDSPAEAAGLMANDRLIALDGYELRDEAFLRARLGEERAGATVRFHLFRAGELLERPVRLDAPQPERYTLRHEGTTAAQLSRLRDWLVGPT